MQYIEPLVILAQPLVDGFFMLPITTVVETTCKIVANEITSYTRDAIDRTTNLTSSLPMSS